MANPYIGQIIMFAGNFPIAGWAICNGQTMQISQNDALYSLIGTTYGGDGVTTFNLPDLRGRVPIHQGTGPSTYVVGQKAGSESVPLTISQLPGHGHSLQAGTNPGTLATPATNALAGSSSLSFYTTNAPSTPMNAAAVATTGSSVPHDNVQPVLSVNFLISLFGIFPSRN
jgi:microcystin-dependent protein